MMLLVFYTLYVLGLDDRGSASHFPAPGACACLAPPAHLVTPLLRVISSLHKPYVCEKAVPAVYACMEALGGVGYLVNAESEHLNVARIFRDACVGAIWEGTTDVLAGDTVRALKHPAAGGEAIEAVEWLVRTALDAPSVGGGDDIDDRQRWTRAKSAIASEWERVKARLVGETQAVLLPEARQAVFRMAEILIATLFLVDVGVNPGVRSKLCARGTWQIRGLLGATMHVKHNRD